MIIDGSFQLSCLFGIWLIGPIGIVVVSLLVFIMCFSKVKANVIKPEPLINDTKEIFHYHRNQFSGQSVQKFGLLGCNCTSHVETNNCSKLWIKSLKLNGHRRLQLPQRHRKELSLLQSMHHTNINPLIGAIVEDCNLYLITSYCNQGSLKELLSNESFSMSKSMIISLIQDLICGLAYIHHSSIACHGRLKTSNCLINSCLRLKVADFGINRLMELSSKTPSSNLVDRLWLAPELLRDQHCRNTDHASRQADVYAFSIILHEIVHRKGPFNIAAKPSVDISLILQQVQQESRIVCGQAECYRPHIKDDPNLEFGCPTYIRHCLEDCWQETPNLRPSIDDVFCRLLLMSNETPTPEFFPDDLDDAVIALQKEKEKKLKLLFSIIPSHAANELVKGLRVKPQIFESVTLLFTNIWNFQQISEASTPHEHIRILDDLYKIFDSIIEGYQVYKVETVKDTYFVASGLFSQERNHTVEAASLALQLVNSLQNYRVPHNPHLKVLLRIGMHLGPVAGGVIGLDKPRFCLFGDTVNMTSRLSTTGEPSHIHISSECHLALSRFGGFKMKFRGTTYIKGKGWVPTYWLSGMDR